MNKTKTFVAAVAVPVALLAMAAQSASAATAPTTTVPGGATVPAGYVQLVDDTNHITVTVPNTWTTVQTDPSQNDDGTPQPWILATAGTDLDNFQSTFVDGVLYVAYPFAADPTALMDQFKLTGGCPEITSTSDNVQPYSDGVFTGLIQVGTGCDTTKDVTWNMVVASPADQSFTAVLQVQTKDPAALQTVLNSFNVVAGAAPVVTTTPGAATTVAGGVTTTVAGGVTTTAVTTPVITPPVQTTTVVTQAVASTVAPVTPTTGCPPTWPSPTTSARS